MRLETVLASYLLVGTFAGACYDAKGPGLPPCEKETIWPDPCTEQEAREAKADAYTQADGYGRIDANPTSEAGAGAP